MDLETKVNSPLIFAKGETSPIEIWYIEGLRLLRKAAERRRESRKLGNGGERRAHENDASSMEENRSKDRLRVKRGGEAWVLIGENIGVRKSF